MLSYVDFIEERSPVIIKEYKERLEAKVAELLGDRQIDDARIATEVTIFADKICVDEETVRLRGHIKVPKIPWKLVAVWEENLTLLRRR